MNKKKSNAHQFAFYVPGLTQKIATLSVGDDFQFTDEALHHRLFRVVRVAVDDACVFFDRENHVQVELFSPKSKNVVIGKIVAIEKNKQVTPNITFWLPLLKRDHFQTALYSLAELGVNQIQPIITKKVQRKWGGQKEFERCQKILIAAAEQSKQFAFPELLEPKLLQACCDSVQNTEDKKIFFDPAGDRFATLAPKLNNKHFILLIGPEGDLTADEKKSLLQQEFMFCALTPTILRAVQAAAISAGIFRTFFNS